MNETYSTTAPAPDFSSMELAPEKIPIWYWNRYPMRKLREAVDDCLSQCSLPPGAPVLELGCGNRAYQRAVQRTGAKYLGADLAGNQHADIVIEADGRVPVEGGVYAAVLSIQVLEHVSDPAVYLAEARRLLRPGGKLILSTHGFWVYHPSPQDFWRWTSAGLQKLLEDNQFKVLSFTGVMGMMPAALQIFQDQLRRHLPVFLSRIFTTLMQTLVGWTDRMHSAAARNRDAMIYVVLLESKCVDDASTHKSSTFRAADFRQR